MKLKNTSGLRKSRKEQQPGATCPPHSYIGNVCLYCGKQRTKRRIDYGNTYDGEGNE